VTQPLPVHHGFLFLLLFIFRLFFKPVNKKNLHDIASGRTFSKKKKKEGVMLQRPSRNVALECVA
jgi:hypothetical protein